MLTANPPPPYLPPSLCLSQFLLCIFLIWGFGVVLRSRSAVVFSFVMLSSLSLGVECCVSVVDVLCRVSCCCGSSIGCCGVSVCGFCVEMCVCVVLGVSGAWAARSWNTRGLPLARACWSRKPWTNEKTSWSTKHREVQLVLYFPVSPDGVVVLPSNFFFKK